jgi:hypothetical protein
MGAVQNVTDTLPLPARLIDSAIALARAERALVVVRMRELAVRAVTALLARVPLATIITTAFAQAAVLLLVLSPFLEQGIAIEALAVAIVLSLGVAFAAAIGALLTWSNVRRSVRQASVLSMLLGVPQPTRAARTVESHPHRASPTTLAERMS